MSVFADDKFFKNVLRKSKLQTIIPTLKVLYTIVIIATTPALSIAGLHSNIIPNKTETVVIKPEGTNLYHHASVTPSAYVITTKSYFLC